MHNLSKVYHRLLSRLGSYEKIFSGWAVSPEFASNRERWVFQEGLVSAIWQSWNAFCRELVISSCLGCQTKTGSVLPGCVTPLKWERVSHLAVRAASSVPPKTGVLNSSLRREPTWGDLSTLMDVIKALGPPNQVILTQVFGGGLHGPEHLQIVRNAAAHLNNQTLGEVAALRPYYSATPLRHPTDATLWIEPTCNDYALIAWCDELRLLADLATD